MPLLMICEPVGLFLKILTVNDKYSLCNGENLHQPIQMELSQKQKTYSQFFAQFLKFKSSFKNYKKEDNPHRLYISEFTACY